ncbi:DUF2961 domain-containing protein [Proteiniphilum sp. X52]|nr:DUF2961 domain-containing protein [Proteiniphilum sp. X52]
MNSTVHQLGILFFMLLISFNVTYTQQVVSFESLLQEMTDRENLAEYPSPFYTCRQFSSYDRASVDPDLKSWFANWDRNMFLRTEVDHDRKEYVLMDAKGPGAIVRIWMTFSGKDSGRGILRIYLDDYSIPAIEGDALSIISGGQLVGAPLSSSVSDLTDYGMRGHNLYLPIPYSDKCKITYESDNIKSMGAKSGEEEAIYYNINYRIYESKTQVKTFEMSQLLAAKELIDTTQKKLTDKDVLISQEMKKDTLQGLIPVGENLNLTIHNDHSAIRKITLRMNAGNYEQALRSTIIHILFDGKKAISCPIGDFFGTGYKIRKNSSWYTKIEDDGTMSCYWVMPFKRKCDILLENRGDQDVKIDHAEIITLPYKWTKNTMYFCSTWKQYSFLRTGEMKNNEGDGFPFDINYVKLKGRGVYVGDCLTLFNTVYAWWGEGDEKIYVDGESFPSHFGTGTEDYYGYAWCRPEKFTGHPFIAQPDGSGNFDPGYTNNVRFRSLDAIPFEKSLRFDMEMWHWTKAVIHFSPITFWYISPTDIKNIPRSNLSDASFPVAMSREDVVSPVIVNNKVEAENMILEKVTGGNFRYSNNVNRGWSNNMQVFWSDMKPKDTLTLSFFSNEERVSDVTIQFSKGPKYGTFSLSINQGDGVIIDSFEENDIINEYTLKNVVINRGRNLLNMEYLMPADKNQIGIDFIELSD